MAIKIKEVPVEAYNSVGKVKKKIIFYCDKLIKLFKINLQIAIKAINNLAKLDKLFLFF